MELKSKLSSQNHSTKTLWGIISIVTILYFALSASNSFHLLPWAMYDDGLQLRISKSIVAGDWLGTYNALTLSKGITFPMWTAMLHTLSIPLWLGNALLYSTACLCILIALRPVLYRNWIFIAAYVILLLNPMITPRIYRDMIAPALSLFVLAWVVGLFFVVTTKLQRDGSLSGGRLRLSFFSSLGIVGLPAWWYLREDSFWVLPFIICGFMSVFVFMLFHVKSLTKVIRPIIFIAFLMSLPFLMVGVVGQFIARENMKHYNRFVINDFTSDDFRAAYGALTRIEDPHKDHAVPISSHMRTKAYDVSPTFSELKECLDEKGDNNLCEYFKNNGNPNIKDYKGGWFFWALRTAAERKGYYENATKAEGFYNQIASEINSACNEERIRCVHGPRVSLASPFEPELVAPTLTGTARSAIYLMTLQDAEEIRNDFVSVGNGQNLELMSDFYNVRYNTHESNNSVGNRIKNNINTGIVTFYKIINPLLMLVGLIIIIFVTSKIHLYKEYWREVLIAWGVLLLITARLAILAYVDTTSFSAINYFYLQSTYPLMFIFEVLTICIFVHIIDYSKLGRFRNSRVL